MFQLVLCLAQITLLMLEFSEYVPAVGRKDLLIYSICLMVTTEFQGEIGTVPEGLTRN